MTAAESTEATLARVVARLDEGGIEHVVVATTSGATGVRFAEALADWSGRVVCVTHHVGFAGGDTDQIDPAHRALLEELGTPIVTAGHALSGVARSISKAYGGLSQPEIIAQTLRLFGQGMKVCVEIAVMAADAGQLPTDRDVIAVAGTGRGADTAVVLSASHMNSFFDMRVREVLCFPGA